LKYFGSLSEFWVTDECAINLLFMFLVLLLNDVVSMFFLFLCSVLLFFVVTWFNSFWKLLEYVVGISFALSLLLILLPLLCVSNSVLLGSSFLVCCYLENWY